MNQCHSLTRTGQNQRFLHGTISTTHNDDILPIKRCTITNGTTAHTSTPHLILSRNTKPITLRPRCNNNRMGLNHTRVRLNLQRPRRHIHLNHSLTFEHSPKRRSLLPHRRNDLWSSHIRQAWIILHIDALSLQLSTKGRCDDYGLETSPSSVDGSGHTGWTATDDRDAFREVTGCVTVSEFCKVFFVFGLCGFFACVFFSLETFFQFFHEFFFGGEVEVGSRG
mmetsp:Transcript_19393/g.28287  ORF Transcript_19393/g.28287 Transcript_19393/m.28287 type:complete len:224 (-) Transcript_19393:762-1433(-)